MSTHSFQGPRCTADVLCYRFHDQKLQVLLVKRKYDPFQGHWAIPGGFVESDETIRVAAERELKEETNLSPGHLEQFRAYGGPERDPRGPVVTICYLGFLSPGGTSGQARSDAQEVGWHDPHDPPRLAFDHQRILTEACDHLAERIQQTPVAFHLLPDVFSIEDAHALYEGVLQTSIDLSEFSDLFLQHQLISPATKPEQEHSRQNLVTLNEERMNRFIRENLPFTC